MMIDRILELAYDSGIILENVDEEKLAEFALNLIVYCIDICKQVENELLDGDTDEANYIYPYFGASLCIDRLAAIIDE